MRTNLFIILLVFTTTLTYGQKQLADKFFENYAYIKASELYQKAYEKGDDSEHVLTRLGDCFYNNSDANQAAKWYKLALENHSDIAPEYIYKYIQTQRSLGNYAEANNWLQKFSDKLANDSRASEIVSNLQVYDDLSSTDQVYVETKNLDINSSFSEFGAFIKGDTVYFASTRNTDGKIYKWNEEPFLDIYQASISSDSLGVKQFANAGIIPSSDVNSDYHEASLAITKDGKTMYFTRDILNKRKRLKYDNEGTTQFHIYKATFNNGAWENIEELPFNNELYSYGHPALNTDESKLYFVSDQEGGLGQTDIYSVTINDDGTYGETVNLGPSVNSEGREMFPFIAKDSTLYFSSDGYLNLGLLDIFKSDVLKGNDTDPINMGAPYNSGADDFAFYIDTETEEGFYSSNREGGKGSDDIYWFSAYQCMQVIKGTVYNSETLNPLSDAVVQKIDENGKILEEVKTNELGEYEFECDCDQTYTILAKKNDYKDDYKNVNTTNEKDKIHGIDLHLIPLIKNDQIVINPIFFDFDKWNIRTDAQYELENIVDVMREHPDMVIKIESHTDSRGSDRYNMKLSDRRAKSTRDYLLSRNIAPDRIESAIGYGESQLLNECANGVRCSKEQHQENRRSYFYIIKD